MINIIDTFRNVIGDKYAAIKLLILAIPVLMSMYAYQDGKMAFVGILAVVVSVVYLAVFFETIRRSCASEPMLMPPFLMPVRMFITLGLTIIASIPSVLVCIALTFGYIELLKIFPDIQQNEVLRWIIGTIYSLLITSIYFASVTQFLNSGELFDSYNPIKVIKALNAFITNLIFFSIQNIIFFCIVGVIPIALIYVIAGFRYDNFFTYLYASFFIVLNFIMWADFLAQTKKESECD